MKKLLLAALLALLCVSLAGCARPGTDPASTQDQRLILVGFSQVGAESDWRKANTLSIKEKSNHGRIERHMEMPEAFMATNS